MAKAYGKSQGDRVASYQAKPFLVTLNVVQVVYRTEEEDCCDEDVDCTTYDVDAVF